MEQILLAAGLQGFTLHRMQNSFSNQVYRVEGPGGPVILKLLKSASKWWADRFVPPLLADKDLPVPDVLGAGQVGEDYWITFSLLPGVNLEDVIDRAPPDTFCEAGRLLARLHTITFPTYGRPGPDGLFETYTDWAGHFRARLERFLAHPLVVPYLSPAERQACRDFFDRHEETLRGGHPCVVHRDYRPGNLLVDPVTYAITGLLDFEAVQSGDPGVDFAKVESEFFRQRPDARPHFHAGYASVRSLPDPREMLLHDLINCIGGIGWAEEHNDKSFLQRNLDRTRTLMAQG